MLQPSMWLTLTNPPQSCHCTGLTWARSHHAIHQPCGCPAVAGQPSALRAAALSSSTGTATATTSTSSNQAAKYLPATQPHSAAHATPAHPAAASTPRYTPNTRVHTCPAGAALHQRSCCLLAQHLLLVAVLQPGVQQRLVRSGPLARVHRQQVGEEVQEALVSAGAYAVLQGGALGQQQLVAPGAGAALVQAHALGVEARAVAPLRAAPAPGSVVSGFRVVQASGACCSGAFAVTTLHPVTTAAGYDRHSSCAG